MGLFGAIAKAGVAKKVFDEARKPENRRKLKSMVAKVQNRGSKGRRGRPASDDTRL